jgi:hypothetical protein
MAGHSLRRALALPAAAAVAVGAGPGVAAAAGGLEGSPAAVHVARQVLAHVRHVTALRWSQAGDQWECPSPDGPIVGPSITRPGRNCRRARVIFDENLRDGRITQSLATTTAAGRSTQAELVSGAGDWTRSGRARCWDAQEAAPRDVPAFTYSGEQLSISARTADVISLRGVGFGLRETDAIDARTFAVREVDQTMPVAGGSAKLVARFAEMTRPFALPGKPRRVCSDVVRFPPQRAR